MTLPLTLGLRIDGKTDAGYRFVLTAVNRTAGRLLLPRPQVTDLQLIETSTAREPKWGTAILQHTDMPTCIVDPAGSADFELLVQPGAWRSAETFHPLNQRWFLSLPPGTYAARYRWTIDEDFFDGDSHWRLANLRAEAAESGAVPWVGSARSNEVVFSHAG